MNRTISRSLVTVAAAGALLTISAGGAFADDCVNLSRNTNPAQALNGAKIVAGPGGEAAAVKGHWVYLGDVWLFVTPGPQDLFGADTSGLPGAQGNFTNGKGDGLLEQSGKASDGRRCPPETKSTGMVGQCGDMAEH